jgi:hypothetical protein
MYCFSSQIAGPDPNQVSNPRKNKNAKHQGQPIKRISFQPFCIHCLCCVYFENCRQAGFGRRDLTLHSASRHFDGIGFDRMCSDEHIILYAQQTRRFDLYYAAYATGTIPPRNRFPRVTANASGRFRCRLLRFRWQKRHASSLDFSLSANIRCHPILEVRQYLLTDQKHLMKIPSTSADLAVKYTPSLDLTN